MAEYRLPSLGADMERATFVEWLVGEGDRVTKGQVVAMIETAKALMEIEFFEDGIIEELLAGAGDIVAVGAPIARYRLTKGKARAPAAGEPAEKPARATEAPLAAGEGEPTVEPAEVEAAAAATAARHASKDVRELSERLGVDLASIAGTGHAGRIRVADVLAVAGQLDGVESVSAPGPPATEASTEAAAERAPRASPRARRLAAQHGIDLATVRATGPHGQITGDDVERHVAETPAGPAGDGPAAPVESEKPQVEAPKQPIVEAPAGDTDADRARARRLAMRQAIADLMARSKREIPHYYLSQQVEMTAALDWLERENLDRPVPERLLPAVLLIKAVAHALEEVPEMNGFWVNDRFVPGEGIHPGIAISLREGGLAAPAIRHANRLGLSELMATLRDLVSRTRGGVLQRAEMTDPTITITNLGDQGVDAVYGVIYPPQVALVGFGRIVERPWSEQGMLGARRVLTTTLAADHRASDGHRGGLFLAAIERWLQQPEKL